MFKCLEIQPKEKPPLKALRFPFCSSSTARPVARSTLATKCFNLKPLADDRSSSKAACARKREVSGWWGKRPAGPSSKIQRKLVEGVSLQVYNPPTTQYCHFTHQQGGRDAILAEGEE